MRVCGGLRRQAVQADTAAATYENGVLTVTRPKQEKAKPRKIAIN